MESNKCLSHAVLALSCHAEELYRAQLGSEVHGSTQVIQPGSEAGVWGMFGNPQALQEGPRGLLGGKTTQVC